MPAKWEEVSDEELEAERKKRRAANRPKTFKVWEVDEDTFKKHFRGGDDDDDDDDDDNAEGGTKKTRKPAGKKAGGYWGGK
jgi:hypothetical protein